MSKWHLVKDSGGNPKAWRSDNPERLDIASWNNKQAKARGESLVVIKGQRIVPSPQWLAMHGLPPGSDEVRSYNFGYNDVQYVLAHSPPGTPIEDIINELTGDTGWKSISSIWWQY